jgi:hypothetical protein
LHEISFIATVYLHFFRKNMQRTTDTRPIQSVDSLELASRWLLQAQNLSQSSRKAYSKRLASFYKKSGAVTQPRTRSARSGLLGALQWRSALRLEDALSAVDLGRIKAGLLPSQAAAELVTREIGIVQTVAATPCEFERGRGMKTRLRRIAASNPTWALDLWSASDAYQAWRIDTNSARLVEIEYGKQNCLAVLLAFGLRVGELEQGIKPMLTEAGAIRVTVDGNKRRDIEGELPRGQPSRTIEVDGDMPWHRRLRDIAATGGTVSVPSTMQGAGLLGKWLAQRARAVGIDGMSCHLLRHAFESDQKVAVIGAADPGSAALEAAGALGHASAASRGKYGSIRSAGGTGSRLVSVQVARPVRPGRPSAAERFGPKEYSADREGPRPSDLG